MTNQNTGCRFMNKSGEVVETNKFHPGQTYTKEAEVLGLEIGDVRSTTLGQNIYTGRSSDNGPEQPQPSTLNVISNKSKVLQTHFPSDASQELAKVRLAF